MPLICACSYLRSLKRIPKMLGSIPMVVGLPQLETKLNAIICGGLVFHNWRHFFLFAINHGKCSCLFLQRMPINWHSMKRRDSSQSLLQFQSQKSHFVIPLKESQESSREERKIGSEN